VWPLIAILRDHEIQVQMIRTTDPGIIVYRDEHQIAAVPNQRMDLTLRPRER
jgi:hypothetical protein